MPPVISDGGPIGWSPLLLRISVKKNTVYTWCLCFGHSLSLPCKHKGRNTYLQRRTAVYITKPSRSLCRSKLGFLYMKGKPCQCSSCKQFPASSKEWTHILCRYPKSRTSADVWPAERSPRTSASTPPRKGSRRPVKPCRQRKLPGIETSTYRSLAHAP